MKEGEKGARWSKSGSFGWRVSLVTPLFLLFFVSVLSLFHAAVKLIWTRRWILSKDLHAKPPYHPLHHSLRSVLLDRDLAAVLSVRELPEDLFGVIRSVLLGSGGISWELAVSR